LERVTRARKALLGYWSLVRSSYFLRLPKKVTT
jgi:hypothetical protein